MQGQIQRKKGQRHSKKKPCFCEDIKKGIKKHELSSQFKEYQYSINKNDYIKNHRYFRSFKVVIDLESHFF
jgi:hypothetical protein